MENQHNHISGYRDLSEDEVDLMNLIKQHEATLGNLLNRIENETANHGDKEAGRWLSLGRTDLERGFMWLVKAIARPSNGLGRKNPK